MLNICKKKAIFRRLQSNDQIESRGNVSLSAHKPTICNSKSANQCCFDCHGNVKSASKGPSFPKLAIARANAAVAMAGEQGGICLHSNRTSPLSLSNTHLSCISYNDSVSPQVSQRTFSCFLLYEYKVSKLLMIILLVL